MKKLMMIAAAVTIAGGVFAQCGDPGVSTCVLVYKVKASLSTTVAKWDSHYSSSACADIESCYRDTGKVSLQGYTLSVCDECDCLGFENSAWYVWDKKGKMYYMDGDEVVYDFIHIIGKKSNKIEVAWSFDIGTAGFIQAAGFGTVDTKKGVIKKVSGELAGYVDAPICLDSSCADVGSIIYTCDTATYNADVTAVFGKWSLSYSAGDSKKAAVDASYLYDKMPDFL